jgi:hypothetical protein
VFTILYGVTVLLVPFGSTAEQQLSVFNANQTLYTLFGVAAALWGTCWIAFAGGFSRIVRQKSRSVSYAAAFLVAAGALTETISTNLYVSSLFAISAAPSTATYASDATYFAAVVSNFTNGLDPLAFSLVSIGMFLFAWVIWKGEVFPSWLSYILLVGGVLGILDCMVLIGLLPRIGQGVGFIILTAVWGFVAGIVLLRTKSTTPRPAK